MKLKAHILTLVLVPILIIGIIIYLLTSWRTNEVMKASIADGLHATALGIRDSLNAGSDGEYQIKKNELWKGDSLNVSKSLEIVDNVKKNTGMEVTVFFGDTRYLTSVLREGKRAIGTQASDKVVEAVLNNGKSYFAERVDVVGEEFFAYYVPLYDESSNEPVGMVFAGISQDDAEGEVRDIVNVIAGFVLLIGLIAAIVVWLLVRRLVKAVQNGSSTLGRLADGDLSIQIDTRLIKRKDEIGDIGRAIQNLHNELKKVMNSIHCESNEVHNMAESLSEKTRQLHSNIEAVEQAVGDVAEGASSQAGETQTATTSVIEIGEMIEATNTAVEQLQNNAAEMGRRGAKALVILSELESTNKETKESIDTIYKQTVTTNESANKIKNATNLITEIAEETNLLSLNASIEAARAGEQGRGFAVVAAQIQKLAEQSNESAKQIEAIVGDLISDSGDAVSTMNSVSKAMEKQTENVSRTEKIFKKVKEGIDSSVDEIGQISIKTERINEVRTKVTDVVQNLTAIAEENAASTEETSAASSELMQVVKDVADNAAHLNEIAEKLKEDLGHFKIKVE